MNAAELGKHAITPPSPCHLKPQGAMGADIHVYDDRPLPSELRFDS